MEEWLRSIGMGAKIAAFNAHGITLDLLQELTDADLRELGLTIGERKRFYRAVVALGDQTPVPVAVSPPEAQAERRPLSTLFVDLVGYTRLSERLDPEDMLPLLRRYRELCAAHVVHFGGYVARMVGDGVLAYFCYPMANENDPERAVRAGLEIAGQISSLVTPDSESLRARLGIASGRVVIGDLFRDSAVDKHSVVGSAPNLAARLQALAQPGELIVDEETHARVRGRFVAADLGSLTLRGLDLPHRAWRILRERPIGDVASVPHRAPLCGRDRELAELKGLWSRAQAGEGGTVLVTGRAGIGKSRLVRAFLDGCVGDGGVTVHVHSSALDTDSPLRAVVAALQRVTGGGGAAGGAARLRRLASLGLPETTLPAIADLLGLAGVAPGPEPEVAPSPEQRRDDTLRALVEAAVAVAGRQSLRLVVEDTHWLDPTSLDLVARLAAVAGDQKLLLIMTAREELRVEQAALSTSHTVLPLQPLAEFDVLRMVNAMVDGHALPPGVLRSIARRAEGVPLFAQELLRTVAIRRSVGPDDEEAEFGGIVPASVHAALIARLDRTGPAKEIAQAASVFGRICEREALAAVCGPMFSTSAADLELAIETLVRTGVVAAVSPEGAPRGTGRTTLAFTHALLRDAAYDSLMRDRRQALHLQVALALRATEPDLVEQQPERLALHLVEGGDPMAAAPLWLEAARRSLSRSALTEATRVLRRALASLPRASASREATELRLEMLALLGPAVMALHGNASLEAAEVYAEANALCQDLPETPAHFPIYWGWWYQSRDFHDKRDRASTILSRARGRGDPEQLLQAHHCAWASHYMAGDYARCCDHVTAGLAIYAETDCRHHARLYANHDARVCAHGELSQVYWMQGKPARALAEEARSLQWAAELDHLGSVSHAWDMQILHRIFRRDHDFVFARAGEFVRFGSDTGMTEARAKGLIFHGWATAVREDPVAGLRSLEQGFEQQKATGTNEDFPIYFCLLAEALIAAGKPERAIDLLAAGEAEHAALGLGFWRSEMRRMRAEAAIAADPGNPEGALRLYGEAQAMAEEQGATMLVLRAAMGTAKLMSGRDGPEAARSLLLPILAAIEGPDDSQDMLAAHALAARLAGLHA